MDRPVDSPVDSPVDRPVALVTGASSGIGAQVARRLAADGFTVVVNSRASVDAGRAVADEVGGTYVQADVGDPDQGRRLVEQVLEQHGRLDVLVNNAGTTVRIPHADLAAATPEVWRRLLDVNLVAPFVLITAAEQALRAEGLEPVRTPIRGGTDGSRLSEMGLPTPNLFTGGHEYHSVREWASLQQMASAAAVIVHLAGLWAER